MLPADPIAAIGAGNHLRVPVMAGNTRDEGKLFPTFLTLLGGPSGRLVSDKQLFDIQFGYAPDAPPQVTIDQWIPAACLPVTTLGTGFNAKTELLNQLFLVAAADNALATLRAQQNEVWYYRFDWDEEPAPFNDIYGAAHAFDLPFVFGNFGPSLFSNVANSTANRPGRLALSRAMMAAWRPLRDAEIPTRRKLSACPGPYGPPSCSSMPRLRTRPSRYSKPTVPRRQS